MNRSHGVVNLQANTQTVKHSKGNSIMSTEVNQLGGHFAPHYRHRYAHLGSLADKPAYNELTKMKNKIIIAMPTSTLSNKNI